MSAADWGELAPEYLRLRAYYATAWGVVSLAPGATEQQRANGRNLLSTARFWLDRLGPEGETGAGVLAGTVTPERWARVANEQGATMQAAMEAVSPVGLVVEAWESIVVASARDAVEGAKDLAEGVKSSLPWAALLGLAVAAIYWRPRR